MKHIITLLALFLALPLAAQDQVQARLDSINSTWPVAQQTYFNYLPDLDNPAVKRCSTHLSEYSWTDADTVVTLRPDFETDSVRYSLTIAVGGTITDGPRYVGYDAYGEICAVRGARSLDSGLRSRYFLVEQITDLGTWVPTGLAKSFFNKGRVYAVREGRILEVDTFSLVQRVKPKKAYDDYIYFFDHRRESNNLIIPHDPATIHAALMAKRYLHSTDSVYRVFDTPPALLSPDSLARCMQPLEARYRLNGRTFVELTVRENGDVTDPHCIGDFDSDEFKAEATDNPHRLLFRQSGPNEWLERRLLVDEFPDDWFVVTYLTDLYLPGSFFNSTILHVDRSSGRPIIDKISTVEKYYLEAVDMLQSFTYTGSPLQVPGSEERLKSCHDVDMPNRDDGTGYFGVTCIEGASKYEAPQVKAVLTQDNRFRDVRVFDGDKPIEDSDFCQRVARKLATLAEDAPYGCQQIRSATIAGFGIDSEITFPIFETAMPVPPPTPASPHS